METERLNYYLPAELIAQRPISVRSDSRLLVFNRSPVRDTAYNGGIIDSRFGWLGDFLSPGDCLVLNDAKVLPARFFARRCSGGKLEGLFLAESATGVWEVMLKGARKIKSGEKLYLADRSTPAIAGSATAGKQKQTRLPKVYGGQDFCTVVVLERVNGGKCRLKVDAQGDAGTILGRIGFPPLPPYIKRNDDPRVAAVDKLRYQTVYARNPGAVAAPTAGLHFTNRLIRQLKQAGICFAYLTLHVGEGTFKPVTAENLEDHQMHQERFSIDEESARIINAA
jgi:S-adenosylmethionine:tRNA ribosyltransferase-isomerase